MHRMDEPIHLYRNSMDTATVLIWHDVPEAGSLTYTWTLAISRVRKLQTEKTQVLTPDKRAARRLIKQSHKAKKTALWRPTCLNILLYYSFQHNRCLSGYFLALFTYTRPYFC